jgi:hypothetical protein
LNGKTFFTNPDLQKLINDGIANNHDLRIAINRMEVARQQLKAANLLQVPEVNLQATGSISRPSDNSLTGLSIKSFIGKSYVENYQTIVSFSWEADIWGKLRSQKESALAEYLQTYEASKAVQTQLVSDIAQGFFNLLMLDRQLEIAKRNFALSDTFFAGYYPIAKCGHCEYVGCRTGRITTTINCIAYSAIRTKYYSSGKRIASFNRSFTRYYITQRIIKRFYGS